jgi:hypothetical protein
VFAATYQGDHLSVRLLEKWVRKRRLEYLVEWKGRPEREFLREREVAISCENIAEFEASCSENESEFNCFKG